MSRVRELHREAMVLVNQAKQSDIESESNVLLKKALDLEIEAAMLLFDKFDAEPTRSVLFRSAATLAYNCGELNTAERMVNCGLSGINVPIEIKEELIQVRDTLIEVSSMNVNELEKYNYLQKLREIAINIRLKPVTPKYSEAVFIEDIVSVLRVVKSSFSNFLKINFLQTFGNEKYGDDTERIISKLRNDFPLLYVNSKFASFGASLSADAVVMTKENYDKEIVEWRKNLFDEFKQDVIYMDYSNLENLDYLNEKYSDEDRALIHKGFTDLFNDSRDYKISFTDKNYSQVIKSGNPVTNQNKDKLFPKITKKEIEDKKLVRTFGMKSANQSQIRKSDIIMSEELNFAEFNHKTIMLEYNNDRLDLKKELELKIIYESGFFTIDFHPFEIHVTSDSFEDTLKEFSKECISKYNSLRSSNKSELSVDLNKVWNNLDEYVFSSTS